MSARAWLPILAFAGIALASAGCRCESEVCFRFPADNSDGNSFIPEVIFHVDNDDVPADGLISQLKCTNYAGEGFPQCYGDHDGSDFLLRGGFQRMDAGSADIVAAADGVVIETRDGNYDRCHASLRALPDGGIDCDGHPMISNYVKLRHANGTTTEYHHMKTDSVAVEVGQQVRCGDVLGKVGSSGRSSTPHVHFEVHDAEGVLLDPYAGLYTQPGSLWVDQGPDDGLPAELCR